MLRVVGEESKKKNKATRDGASSVHRMAGASSSTLAEENLAAYQLINLKEGLHSAALQPKLSQEVGRMPPLLVNLPHPSHL